MYYSEAAFFVIKTLMVEAALAAVVLVLVVL
jgi:hypothetical protein